MAYKKLEVSHRFFWKDQDFVNEATTAADDASFRAKVGTLAAGPSVVVTDPISLFNPIVSQVFKRLGDYAKRSHSLILSISPIEQAAAERLYGSLLSNGSPVLDAHLFPQIPTAEPFALCGVNIQHAMDVERLLRSSLGQYYLQKKKSEAKPILALGVSG